MERAVDTSAALAQARVIRAAILAERGGALLPDSAEVIQSIREARDDELAGLR
jgi:hypothetical protein